jgi:hypothetical protein
MFTGLDPYLDLLVVGAAPAVIGLPVMEFLTSIAVFAYFWRDRRGMSAWRVLVCPAVAAAMLAQPGARMTSTRSVIAKAILRAATARRPKTRYKAGYGARPMILLSRILPDRVFDAVTRRLFALPTD